MRENQREIKILLKNLNRHIFTWRSKCQWLRTDDQGLAEFWYHVVRWVHWSVQQSQSGLNQMYFQRSMQYFCGWVFDRSWTVWSGLKVGLLDFFCTQKWLIWRSMSKVKRMEACGTVDTKQRHRGELCRSKSRGFLGPTKLWTEHLDPETPVLHVQL